MTILSIGDIAWDIVIRPRTDIIWGSDTFGPVRLSPGGSAANVAVWARREGLAAAVIGKIGDDPLGLLMRAHLDREGVTGAITVPGAATTRVAALVAPSGERAFVTDDTTLLGFAPGEIAADAVHGASLLFVNGYAIFTSGGAAFLAPLLAEARARGIPIAFDPSSFALVRSYGAERLLRDVGRVTFLLVNEEEAASLAPVGPEALLDGADTVVLKQGARGATVLTPGRARSAPPPAVAAIDTTGAGDAFDAGFATEYLRSRDLDRALVNGNRLGALVASRFGAQ